MTDWQLDSSFVIVIVIMSGGSVGLPQMWCHHHLFDLRILFLSVVLVDR